MDHPAQTYIAHQLFNGATDDGEPFTIHLLTGLAHAINSEVLGERACDFGLEYQVTSRPRGKAQWISSQHGMLALSGRADLQALQLGLPREARGYHQ